MTRTRIAYGINGGLEVGDAIVRTSKRRGNFDLLLAFNPHVVDDALTQRADAATWPAAAFDRWERPKLDLGVTIP